MPTIFVKPGRTADGTPMRVRTVKGDVIPEAGKLVELDSTIRRRLREGGLVGATPTAETKSAEPKARARAAASED